MCSNVELYIQLGLSGVYIQFLGYPSGGLSCPTSNYRWSILPHLLLVGVFFKSVLLDGLLRCLTDPP
ncbi:hypothetical protein U1Q18_039727 [Sarracenia purpurea var. burkii]